MRPIVAQGSWSGKHGGLLSRIPGRKGAAFLPGRSMEKYYRQLVHYLTVRLRDQHLAADVAHDAYVRVLEGGRGSAAEYPQASSIVRR